MLKCHAGFLFDICFCFVQHDTFFRIRKRNIYFSIATGIQTEVYFFVFRNINVAVYIGFECAVFIEHQLFKAVCLISWIVYIKNTSSIQTLFHKIVCHVQCQIDGWLCFSIGSLGVHNNFAVKLYNLVFFKSQRFCVHFHLLCNFYRLLHDSVRKKEDAFTGCSLRNINRLVQFRSKSGQNFRRSKSLFDTLNILFQRKFFFRLLLLLICCHEFTDRFGKSVNFFLRVIMIRLGSFKKMLDRNIKALFHVFFDSIFDFCNCIIIKRQGYFNFLVTVPHDCRNLHGFITIYFRRQNRRGCIIEINQLVNVFSFQQGRVGII